MKRLVYYIALPFIYLISLCPFWLLYGISNFMFIVLYYVIGYRKKIIYTNLRNSFPEKPEKEIRCICKTYFRYLCDLILETFKTLTISREKALEHCYMTEETVSVFNNYYEQNKSAIIVLGHLGNWEWAGNSFALQCKHHLNIIYHPLENIYFNTLIVKIRTRFGNGLIAMKDTFRQMTKNKNECTATAFIADQTPPPENAHWTNFLNQDTPVFKGTELMAARFNYPVIYINVIRIKRGYYKIQVEDVIDDPSKTHSGYISEWHTKKLEELIKQQPETWLWSHRRWKHSRSTQILR